MITSFKYTTPPGTIFNTAKSNALGLPMVIPVSIKLASGNWWVFPDEPSITVSGGNVVAKRTVAKSKGRGTIKERWSQDDYSITIAGSIINHDDESVYPEEAVRRLKSFCEAKEAIEVKCDLLGYFDITRMVIESFDFPFTKGENAQAFSIKAVSDDIIDLLVEE